MTKYYPRLLNDLASPKDEFTDKSHESIANAIIRLINSQDKCSMIGLEGSWGSGKSTIIKIIEEKISKDFNFINFDAWAHSKQDIRKAFILRILKNFHEKGINSWLEEIRKADEITNNQYDQLQSIINNTNISRSEPDLTTDDVIHISFYSFFFILLNTLISSAINNWSLIYIPDFIFQRISVSNFLVEKLNLVTKFTSGISLIPSLKFFISILLFLVFSLCIKYLFSPKKISQIFDKTSQVTTTATNLDSIIFSDLFKLIIRIHKEAKWIFVLDNLDRIQPSEAIEIFSTLQIFTDELNHGKNLENISFIIPYAQNGLKTIWKNEEDNDLLVQMLLKKFQTVFYVPPIPYINLKVFFKKVMCEAFPSKSKENANGIINLDLDLSTDLDMLFSIMDHCYRIKQSIQPLVNTIDDSKKILNPDTSSNFEERKYSMVYDRNLTPREVIRVVNNIVAMVFIWGNRIPIKYILCFILFKRFYPELDFGKEIVENDQIFDEDIINMLDEDKEKRNTYFSMLNLSLDADPAKQFLYMPYIIQALLKGDYKKLQLYRESYIKIDEIIIDILKDKLILKSDESFLNCLFVLEKIRFLEKDEENRKHQTVNNLFDEYLRA